MSSNTNGVKIDGFQFIANLDGTASPVVTDGDPVTAGVQIATTTVAGLSSVTNSVVPQGTAQVIRYAMITQSASAPFSSTTPTKIATIDHKSVVKGKSEDLDVLEYQWCKDRWVSVHCQSRRHGEPRCDRRGSGYGGCTDRHNDGRGPEYRHQ